MDERDALADEVGDLQETMAGARTMTRAFADELEKVRAGSRAAALDLGRLERSFSGGVKRAFEGLVFEGRGLSDVFAGLARTMSRAAYSAAVRPVTDHVGGLLAQGVGGLMEGVMPFARGGAFSGGRERAVARGPTVFAMRGGTGLMGEAGPEAVLPLARGADGRLGVRAEGGGPAPVRVTMHVTTPDVEGFRRSRGQVAAELARAIGRGQRNR